MTSGEWIAGAVTVLAVILLVGSLTIIGKPIPRRELIAWNVTRVVCLLVVCWWLVTIAPQLWS